MAVKKQNPQTNVPNRFSWKQQKYMYKKYAYNSKERSQKKKHCSHTYSSTTVKKKKKSKKKDIAQ